MATTSTLEQISVTSAQRTLLEKDFKTLLNSFKSSKGFSPHISNLPKEQQEEITKKAADLIRKDAPTLVKAIDTMIKDEVTCGLYFRNLPMNQLVPKPTGYTSSKDTLGATGAYSTNGDEDYYTKHRPSTFADLFALGVKHLIIERTGYQPDSIRYSELVNNDAEPGGQPFHRDHWDADKQKPRYSILSCNRGHSFANTHIINERAAISSLTDKERQVLNEPRFEQYGINRHVLVKEGGKYYLSSASYFDDISMPDDYTAQDPEAATALESLKKAVEKFQEKVNLRNGDFLLLDQDYALHRAGRQTTLLPRHLSRIEFKGEPDRSRWTVPSR